MALTPPLRVSSIDPVADMRFVYRSNLGQPWVVFLAQPLGAMDHTVGYRSVQPPSDAWNMDNFDATVANTSFMNRGFNPTLTLTLQNGALARMPGKYNQSVLLDGVDDFIQINSAMRTATRTISFWVTLDVVRKQMLSVSDVAANVEYLGMNLDGSMSWGDFNTPSYTVLNTAVLTWNTDQPYLLTTVRTPAGRFLYRDGALVGSDGHGTLFDPGAANYGFGKLGSGSLATYVALKGRVDDILIWDSIALPTAQVALIFSSTESGAQPDVMIPELTGSWSAMDVFELTDFTWLFVLFNEANSTLYGYRWNPNTKTTVTSLYVIASGLLTTTVSISRLRDLSLGMYIIHADGSAQELRSFDNGLTWSFLEAGTSGITQAVLKASMHHTPGTNNLGLAEIREVRGDRVALNFSAQDSPALSWRCNEVYTGVPATDNVVPDYGTNNIPGAAENGAGRISASSRRAGEGARLFLSSTARLRVPVVPQPTDAWTADNIDVSGLNLTPNRGSSATIAATIVNGGVSGVAGKYNEAINLDGIDDYIGLNDKLRYATRTVSFWVNLDTVRKQMLAVSDVASMYEYLGMELSGELRWGWFISGYNVLSSAALSWTTGQQYLITMVHTPAGRSLYRDGVLVASDSLATLFDVAGASNYGFGKSGAGSLSTFVALDGRVDDILVWNGTALSQPHVGILFTNTYSGTSSSSTPLNFVTAGSLVVEMWIKRSISDSGFARAGYANLLTNDPSEALANGAFAWSLFPDGRQKLTWGTATGTQSIEQTTIQDVTARRVSKIGELGTWYHLGIHWTLGSLPKLLLNSSPVLTRVVQGTGIVAPTVMQTSDWIIGDPSATGTRGLAGSLVNGLRVFTSTATRTLTKIENYNRGVGL